MEISNCTETCCKADCYDEAFVDEKILDEKVSKTSKEILDDVYHRNAKPISNPKKYLSSVVHLAEVIEKIVDIVENNDSYQKGSEVDRKIRNGGQFESAQEYKDWVNYAFQVDKN